MEAYTRDFADPLEGMAMQLEELKGFARTVPPLIEADRLALWDRIADSPGDEDSEIVDIYARESGEGTGGGFAKFDRTVWVAALVLGWQAFCDYLALHLAKLEHPRRFGRRTVRDDLESEITALTFPKLLERYARNGIALSERRGWHDVREIQLTRNALVHNHGRYTPEYLRANKPRYPVEDDAPFLRRPKGMKRAEWHQHLVDLEDIPLDCDYVCTSLDRLAAFAASVERATT